MGGQVGERFDVVIAGGGNAAFCAAHAAREKVERVLILEKAPREWAGGNSYFTAGAFRTTFGGLEDLEPLLDNPDEALLERTKLDPYTPEDFMADMVRVTEGECDMTLTRCPGTRCRGDYSMAARKGAALPPDVRSAIFRGGRRAAFLGRARSGHDRWRQGTDGTAHERRCGEWDRGSLREPGCGSHPGRGRLRGRGSLRDP